MPSKDGSFESSIRPCRSLLVQYATDTHVRLPASRPNDALGESTNGSSHQIPPFPIFSLSFTPDSKFCPARNRNSAYQLHFAHDDYHNHHHLRSMDLIDTRCSGTSGVQSSVAQCHFGCRCGDNTHHVYGWRTISWTTDMEQTTNTSHILLCYKSVTG